MKIRTITHRDLRNDSAAVLREVEAGQTLIISRNGTPVGELRPIQQRRFVPRVAIAEAVLRGAPIDAARFRANLDVVAECSRPQCCSITISLMPTNFLMNRPSRR